MPLQLPLGITLPESTVFESFFPGDNAFVVDVCQALARTEREGLAYIWGKSGVGKTHLLQAACVAAAQCNKSSAYLPMDKILAYGPEVFDGLESLHLICIDDVTRLASLGEWEVGLFNLINHCHGRAQIIVAADLPPADKFVLPDLVSRLRGGLVMQVKELDDIAKLRWIQAWGQRHGLEVKDEVGHYILNHYPRDMSFIKQALNCLDQASLIAKRKLTIQLVKAVLNSEF